MPVADIETREPPPRAFTAMIPHAERSPEPAPDDARPGPSARGHRALLAAVIVLATLPVLLSRHPALYDYHHWVFEGRVTAALLFPKALGTTAASATSAVWELRSGLPPNLAAPVALALLNLILPPLAAGRAFLLLLTLGFGLGFAFLVRSLQGRTTPLELLGFPFAYGYFLAMGYLSYLASLALLFVALAVLHRGERPGSPDTGRGRLAALAAFGVLLFLSHLVGWLVFAAAVGLTSADHLRRRDWRRAIVLLVTLQPALVLLALELASGERNPLLRYATLGDKLLSLAEAPLLFLRADPLPSLVPPFLANLAGFSAIAAVVLAASAARRESLSGGSGRYRLLALLLLLGAAALPFSDVGPLVRPDERLVLPALLVGLAALPQRRPSRRLTVAAGAVATALVLLTAAEWQARSHALENIVASSAAAIPPGAPALSLSIHGSRLDGACVPGPGFSVGPPALRWLGLERLMERDGATTNLMETSLVRRNSRPAPLDLAVQVLAPGDIEDLRSHAGELSQAWPYVEAFGCPDDLAALNVALASSYAPVAGSEFQVVLARHP